MDVHKIANLHAVARAGSYSAAAAELNISQPALSRSIAALEKSIGARLVKRERGRSGIEMTEAGLDLLTASSGLLAELANVEARYSIAREANSERLAFGLGPMLASVLAPGTLRELMTAPRLTVRVDVGSGHAALNKIVDGTLDFFLGPIPPEGVPGRLRVTHFDSGFQPKVWVREGHPLLALDGSAKMLDALRNFPKLSGTAWNEVVIRNATLPDEVALVSTVQVDNHEILIELARHSDGVLISSVDCARHGFIALTGDLLPLQLVEEVHLFHPKGVTLSPPARKAIALLREGLNGLLMSSE